MNTNDLLGGSEIASTFGLRLKALSWEECYGFLACFLGRIPQRTAAESVARVFRLRTFFPKGFFKCLSTWPVLGHGGNMSPKISESLWDEVGWKQNFFGKKQIKISFPKRERPIFFEF